MSHQKTHSKSLNRIYGVAACLTAGTMLASSTNSDDIVQRPSIAIGIVVEGLDTDYLSMLAPYFTDNGFKYLMNNGLFISNLNYGTGLDATAATAVLYTGASPSINGIPAAYIYVPESKTEKHIFFDANTIGNFTDETYSPIALQVSTLTDEVCIDSDGFGSAYSLAADEHQAIIMAGHASNGGYWISDKNGNWATSAFYRDVPQAIKNSNYNMPLSNRLDTLTWTPLAVTKHHHALWKHRKQALFKHKFPDKKHDRYKRFKVSPEANSEVTRLGIEFINTLHFGHNDGMDMLNVAYTLAPYNYGEKSYNLPELIDAYLRLDLDIAKLIKTAEHAAGTTGVIIFLAGTPATTDTQRDDEKWKIPYGQFSVKRATSLLNMYLIATHGNGDWVTGYYRNNFYLNNRLVKERGLDIADIRAEVADFLGRMSGIADVYTIDDIIASRVGEHPDVLKRNTSLKHTGDVIISIHPGWETVDDLLSAPSTVKRAATYPTPAFIIAPGLKQTTINTPVDARAFAPTVARILRIRSPNGASVHPLRF